jgi:hypothetical protein
MKRQIHRIISCRKQGPFTARVWQVAPIAIPLFVLVASIAGCVSVTPRTSRPVQYSFDCDVPAGRYSNWTQSIDAEPIHVSGKLRLLAAISDPKWLADANVVLVDSRSPRTAGLRLVVDPNNLDSMAAALYDKEGSVRKTPIASPEWSDRSIPFVVSLTAAGLLTASFDGLSQSTQINGFKPDLLELNCSTGQFKYSDVSVSTGSDATNK